MEQSIFQIMWENTPTVTIFLFAIMLSGIVTYKVMKFYARFQKTESQANAVESIQKWQNTTETRLAVIETKLDMIIEKVNFLTEIVMNKIK